MSAGHGDDIVTRGLSAVTINRLLENPEIRRRLYGPHVLNRDFDLPYLGGYSKDGTTIYIDRHFPDILETEDDGHRKQFNPIIHVLDHERFEKAIMDVLGWNYSHSHEAANGFERRGVLKAGLMWGPYNKALDPFIKSDEHERLKKLPADLDMSPYTEPPVNRRLLDHMEAVMGKSKRDKRDVDYETVASIPSRPCRKCVHFIQPSSCEKVRGHINSGGWCKLWQD